MSTEPIKHLASGLTAAEFAAQAWCTDATKNKTMDPELAFAFAAILDRILNELHNWQQDSAGFHGNAEFYRGLLTKIGEGFGIEAKTSDDGSVQEDVLALKVPELVDRLRAALDEAKRELGALHGKVGLLAERLYGISNNLPTDETFEKIAQCAQADQMRLNRMEKSREQFDASRVDFLQRFQNGEYTVIAAAQIIETALAASQAQVGEMQKDKERLDWLDEVRADVLRPSEHDGDVEIGVDDHNECGEWNHYKRPRGTGDSIRAAIDSARADAARKEPPAKAHGCEVGE